MDSVRVFGYRDQPERCFLRTVEGSSIIFESGWWYCTGFDLKLNYVMRCPYQLFYQDGVLHLTIFLDEDLISSLQLARIPNCAAIHVWISRANQLFRRR